MLHSLSCQSMSAKKRLLTMIVKSLEMMQQKHCITIITQKRTCLGLLSFMLIVSICVVLFVHICPIGQFLDTSFAFIVYNGAWLATFASTPTTKTRFVTMSTFTLFKDFDWVMTKNCAQHAIKLVLELFEFANF